MRTLLFDIDGTLLLTNRGGASALALAVEQEFDVSNVCMDVNFSGRTDRSLLVEILQKNELPTSQDSQLRLGQVYASLLPDVLNDRGGQVLPGVVELLERVSDTPDLRCYVMTGNLHASAMSKLQHFGLTDYFRGIFGGDHDCDRNNLAVRTAGALRERYGASATDDLIVIGDTPADIRCGHTIEAQVVAVCTGVHDRSELQAENPAVVVDDLSDVLAVFRILTQENCARASRQ